MPPCYGLLLLRRCCRQLIFRQVLHLLSLAAVVSLLVPNAPLNRRLQSQVTERQRLLAENEDRLQHSQQFLRSYRTSVKFRRFQSFSLSEEDDPQQNVQAGHAPRQGVQAAAAADVGVAVLTLRRGRTTKEEDSVVPPKTQYLTQSVARLLEVLNDTSLARSYRLVICNVDEQPEMVEEATKLEDVVPVWRRFGSTSQPAELGSAVVGKWQKYKMDYVYCLRQTLAQGVQYALLVEDDAVAHEQLFHVVEHVLRRVVERHGASPVAYIKLYHPQRVLGYISLEVERLTELAALALTVGTALTLLSRLTGSCCHTLMDHVRTWLRPTSGAAEHSKAAEPPSSLPSARPPTDHSTAGGEPQVSLPSTTTETPSASSSTLHRGRRRRRPGLWWTWVWWVVVVAVLALAVGRVNLLELRRLSAQLYQVTPTPSCCTPAVLYTQRGARRLADFFLNVTCTAERSIDMRMDDFRARTGERGLLVQPSLFEHIGLVSSLRNREVDPLIIP